MNRFFFPLVILVTIQGYGFADASISAQNSSIHLIDPLTYVEPSIAKDRSLQTLYLEEQKDRFRWTESGKEEEKQSQKRLQEGRIPWKKGAIGSIILLVLCLFPLGWIHLQKWIAEKRIPSFPQQAKERVARLDHSSLSPEKRFIELMEILRWYLQMQYSYPAQQQTTEEMFSLRKDSPQLQKIPHSLFLQFALADQVKFGDRPLTEMHWKEIRKKSVAFFQQEDLMENRQTLTIDPK